MFIFDYYRFKQKFSNGKDYVAVTLTVTVLEDDCLVGRLVRWGAGRGGGPSVTRRRGKIFCCEG